MQTLQAIETETVLNTNDDETRAEPWAARVNAQAATTVASILALGRLLAAAKEALPYGEWGRMFAERLIPFSQDMAGRLMAVARHPSLSEQCSESLPSSWATLYELSLWEPAELSRAVQSGDVSPKTTRRRARDLRPRPTIKLDGHPASKPIVAPPVVASAGKGLTVAQRAERVEQMRELAASGASLTQLSATFKISETSIRNILKRAGIDLPADRVMRGCRRLDSTRIMEQTVVDAEALTADIGLITFAELPTDRLADWVARLTTARVGLNALIRHLHETERTRTA